MKFFLLFLSSCAIVASQDCDCSQCGVPEVDPDEIEELINEKIFVNVNNSVIIRVSNPNEYRKTYCSDGYDMFKIRNKDIDFFLFNKIEGLNHSVLLRCNKEGRIMIADYKGFESENSGDVITRHMRVRSCDESKLTSEPQSIRYEDWNNCPESNEVTLKDKHLKDALWASFDKYAQKKGYRLVPDGEYIIYTSESMNGPETVFKVAK